MAINAGPDVIEDGLVLCLDAANKRSYPGAGTTWTDRVGEYDGTLTNGPTFSNDNGGSIVFDGSNDYVQITTSSSNVLSFSNMSAGCWFKTSSTQSITPLFTKISEVFTGNNGWLLMIDSPANGDYPYFSPKRATTAATASQDVRDGNWHYVIGTHDGTNAKIYVDGVLKDTVSNSNTSNTVYHAVVGAFAYVGNLSNFAEANIASVHIYDRALDDSEVSQNYEATVGRYI